MRMEAARTRRWALLSAPILMGCAGLGMRAGGGAAGLMCCLMLSAVKGPYRYPYPRRRSLAPQRLFFAWSAGALVLILSETMGKALLAGQDGAFQFLCYLSAVCPACVLCAYLLALPLPRKGASALGTVFFLLTLLLLIAGR